MSSNGDIFKYYLKLLIRNIHEPFIYEVGVEEVERLKHRLSLIPEKDPKQIVPKLFCINTVNKLTLAISVDDIQLAHFLWEKDLQQDNGQEIDDDDLDRLDIHFYFRNIPHKYAASVSEAVSTASLYFQLELGTFDESEFSSFLDIDGEEVSIRLSDIVLVEFKTAVLDEGFRELNKESTEQNN